MKPALFQNDPPHNGWTYLSRTAARLEGDGKLTQAHAVWLQAKAAALMEQATPAKRHLRLEWAEARADHCRMWGDRTWWLFRVYPQAKERIERSEKRRAA